MKEPTGSPLFPMMFVAMSKTCRNHGYALTVHGSMCRDLDLVAIPWVESADTEEALVFDLIKEHGLLEGSPSQKDKPHGRHAYVFVNYGGEATGYIDLSVMPRQSRQEGKP